MLTTAFMFITLPLYLQAQIQAITKPYQLFFTGRQLIIKGKTPIINLMVWTIDGHRIIEQKNIRKNQIQLELPIYRNTYFIMIEMTSNQVFTEKLAVPRY